MARKIYKLMELNQLEMNAVSYGCFLSTLSRNGFLDEALNLLEVLARKEEANVVMYNTVLNGCSMQSNGQGHADHCIQLMNGQGVKKDECSFTELIKLAGTQGDLKATMGWWKELASFCQPSAAASSAFIIALCRMNAITEAREALIEMVAVHLEKGSTHVFSSNKLLYERVAVKTSEKPQDSAHELKEYDVCSTRESTSVPHVEVDSAPLNMRCSSMAVTVERELHNAYNALINAAGKACNHLLAESLFAEMRELGLKVDIWTYNALIRAVAGGRGAPHALRIVKRMASTGIRPDVHTFTALVEVYCQNKEFSKAEAVLSHMEQGCQSQRPSCWTYNILLKSCAQRDDPSQALELFARMKHAGVIPDSCTYVALFAIFGNVRSSLNGSEMWPQEEVAKRLTAIELDMAQSGVVHTKESLNAVIHVLGEEGMLEAMLERFHLGQNDKCQDNLLLDTTTYNTVIQRFVATKQVKTGWEIYQGMKSFGVKPNVWTYNILINSCTYEKRVRDAFGLFYTMQQEGIAPDVITFNSLMKGVCYNGDLDAVFDLLQEMTTYCIHPNTTTFNTILASASHHKRVDVIEYTLEEMRRQNVLPDCQTLLPVVTMYTHFGRTEDAVEAMKVLSLRMLFPFKQDSSVKETSQFSQIQDVWKELSQLKTQFGEGTRKLLKDAVQAKPGAAMMYYAALAGLIQGTTESWVTDESPWEARLQLQYNRRKHVS